MDRRGARRLRAPDILRHSAFEPVRPLQFYRLAWPWLRVLHQSRCKNRYDAQSSAVFTTDFTTRRVAGTSERTPRLSPLNRNRRHTDLRDRFNSDVDPISKTVGNLLHVLNGAPEEADYQLAPPLRFRNRSIDARQFMDFEHSQQLLDALETYSPGEAEDGCNCPVGYTSG